MSPCKAMALRRMLSPFCRGWHQRATNRLDWPAWWADSTPSPAWPPPREPSSSSSSAAAASAWEPKPRSRNNAAAPPSPAVYTSNAPVCACASSIWLPACPPSACRRPFSVKWRATTPFVPSASMPRAFAANRARMQQPAHYTPRPINWSAEDVIVVTGGTRASPRNAPWPWLAAHALASPWSAALPHPKPAPRTN